MFFKLEHLLHELTIGFSQQPLSFKLGQDHSTSVSIRPLTVEEKTTLKTNVLLAVAITEEQPGIKIIEIFEGLANSQMPKEMLSAKIRSQTSKYIDENGKLQHGYIPRVEWFPGDFQNFEAQVHQELSNSIKRAAKIVRWRYEIRSTHRPTHSSKSFSWSFDNEHWHLMPQNISAVDAELNIYMPIFPDAYNDMQNLLLAEVNEPLGHELFLEAWQQRSNNPRSALVVGMVAAEVGLKECIGKLVPEADWLVNHLPSPPLHKMISEYLPLLPAKQKIQGQVLRPPKQILTLLNKGAQARNETVHAGNRAPEIKALKELLLAVRDLLYLLDFYCGHNWALGNIRHEVREAMEKEHGIKFQF